jgi:hypothetical protein
LLAERKAILSALLALLSLACAFLSSPFLLLADLCAIAFAPPDFRRDFLRFEPPLRLEPPLLLDPFRLEPPERLLARLRFAINAANFLFHKNTASTICFAISQKT